MGPVDALERVGIARLRLTHHLMHQVDGATRASVDRVTHFSVDRVIHFSVDPRHRRQLYIV